MTNEQLQEFIRVFNQLFNAPNVALADKIFAPNFVAHFPIAPKLNRKSYKVFIKGFYDAFPDMNVEVKKVIVAPEEVILRVVYTGTHLGCFLGIHATGREIKMPGICIFKIKDSEVVENWTEIDIFGVLRQISNLPPLDADDNPPYLN